MGTAPSPFIHNPPVVHYAVHDAAPVVHPAPFAHAAYGHGLLGHHGLGYGYAGLIPARGIVKRDAAVLHGRTTVLTAPSPFIHNPPVAHHAVHVAAPVHAPLGYHHG